MTDVAEKGEYFLCAMTVEVACRLVGQQQPRVARKRPLVIRHALALTHRELSSPMLQAVPEVKPL